MLALPFVLTADDHKMHDKAKKEMMEKKRMEMMMQRKQRMGFWKPEAVSYTHLTLPTS